MVRFCTRVLESVAPHVPCVKIQTACFERYLWPGVKACHHLIRRASQLGLLVIVDAKRGDIGISAEHYAAGWLAPSMYKDLDASDGPDALTVHSYLGADALGPWLTVAQRDGKGIFALVRTSNPGSDAIQSLSLGDGRTVAEAIGQLISTSGSHPELLGYYGYSLLGAVVGATKAKDAARLRELMPQQIFLVPGIGAQGGRAEDLSAFFRPDGTGAIITVSRSILYAYELNANPDWCSTIEQATLEIKHQISSILG